MLRACWGKTGGWWRYVSDWRDMEAARLRLNDLGLGLLPSTRSSSEFDLLIPGGDADRLFWELGWPSSTDPLDRGTTSAPKGGNSSLYAAFDVI